MKIALLGYGKMGKIIEQVAINRGHEIVIKTSNEDGYDINLADVAIDFSVPTAAFFNVVNCFKHQIPVVSGTTGWLHNYDKAIEVNPKFNRAYYNRGISKLLINDKVNGCLDLSKAGELGNSEAYSLIQEYCN